MISIANQAATYDVLAAVGSRLPVRCSADCGRRCSKKPAGKRYELQGRVVAVDSGARELTIAHQDIPGLMPGMTMPFLVARNEDWIFGKIGPGDHIHATLVMTDHAELQDISFTKGSDTASDGTSNVRIPEPGDDVPDFTLVNQFGQDHSSGSVPRQAAAAHVHLYALPRARFLPAHEQQLQRGAEGNCRKALRPSQKAQLLSISIDPDYDKPSVLQSYGKRYVGDVDPDFQHWQFASGSPRRCERRRISLDSRTTRRKARLCTRLQTVLIGADGKVAKVYPGNQWKPETWRRIMRRRERAVIAGIASQIAGAGVERKLAVATGPSRRNLSRSRASD